MKKKLIKKVIIFDLDGVLIDSKSNMKISWKSVQEKFNLYKVSFENYFSKIGQPFYKILDQLKILKDQSEIKKCYDNSSIKNLKLIKFYPDVLNILNKLKSEKFILCIVTSKDKKRTKIILNKYKKYFTFIQSPEKGLRGKPFPDQILKVIKKLKVNKKYCLFVGDTNIDYKAAKKAGIDFLFAEWGYQKKKKIYKNSLSSFKKINKLIELSIYK